MKWNVFVSALLAMTVSAMACTQDLLTSLDTQGEAGRLTVHSSIDSEASSSSPLIANLRGHSWLSYESFDGGKKWTVGTWDEGIGVGVRKSRKGVNVNLEKYRHPNAYRTTLINQSQYQRLVASIQAHDDWSLEKNCSYFASRVWNEVTGEALSNWTEVQDRELKGLAFGQIGWRTIPLPSPAGLFDSIFITNGHYFNNDSNRIRALYESIYPPKPLSPQEFGLGLMDEGRSSSL